MSVHKQFNSHFICKNHPSPVHLFPVLMFPCKLKSLLLISSIEERTTSSNSVMNSSFIKSCSERVFMNIERELFFKTSQSNSAGIFVCTDISNDMTNVA